MSEERLWPLVELYFSFLHPKEANCGGPTCLPLFVVLFIIFLARTVQITSDFSVVDGFSTQTKLCWINNSQNSVTIHRLNRLERLRREDLGK